jgi:ppGpp synthetase/RelA/SpoT-type nucleotidyltranferase
MIKSNILKSYDDNKKLYNNLQNKLIVLLQELLLNNVNYHDISSRVKEKDSLEKKIDLKNGKYLIIEDITDIVGCRIISYFEDDVKKIVEIIKNEFTIDDSNSINKKAIIESDKFGYLSYHLVCTISTNRLSLPEYIPYKNIKFEIQVRSILQHAWAEIEHDIGYKSSIDIPKEIKRKFSRIAGLLETADENFCEIKKSIKNYESKIGKSHNNLLETDLNLNSLFLFTRESKIVKELDNYIASANINISLDEDPDKDFFSGDIKRLNYFKINTIENLDLLLKEKAEKIKSFTTIFLGNAFKDGCIFKSGICYFYLSYILILENSNVTFQKEYLNEYITNEDKEDLYNRISLVYEKIR